MTSVAEPYDPSSQPPLPPHSLGGHHQHSSTAPPSPGGSSPPNHTFDSSMYLNSHPLPPLPVYDMNPAGHGGLDGQDGGMLMQGAGGQHQPEASGSGLPPPPPMIQFDPKSTPPDEEEVDDLDRRPKKRKSTANLRGAAASQSARPAGDDVDDDDDDKEDKGRRKIQIEYIEEKSKRHITFSKRKAGIMKKAYELSTLTGTQVLLLVVSESGWVYTFTTDKFKPLVKEDEHGQLSQGQKLIAACLEAKDGSPTIPQNPSFHPTPSNASFEANSAIHGGQIALKPNRAGPPRPTATNRRVSSKGRNHIPTAIRTGQEPGGIPPIPQLPTPMSGYLDPALGSPISPRGPRSLSHPPISPRNASFGQQQGQEYAEMLQRADMLHMQQQQQQYDGGYESLYSQNTPSSMPQHSLPMLAMHDPLQHDGYHHEPLYSQPPPQQQQQHYTHHPDPNQQQQQRPHFQQQQSLGHGGPPLGQQQGQGYGHDEGTYVSR